MNSQILKNKSSYNTQNKIKEKHYRGCLKQITKYSIYNNYIITKDEKTKHSQKYTPQVFKSFTLSLPQYIYHVQLRLLNSLLWLLSTVSLVFQHFMGYIFWTFLTDTKMNNKEMDTVHSSYGLCFKFLKNCMRLLKTPCTTLQTFCHFDKLWFFKYILCPSPT